MGPGEDVPANLRQAAFSTSNLRPAAVSWQAIRLNGHDGVATAAYATTVFAEMSALAARLGAVNLGLGFPDEDGPPAMLKAAQDAIAEGINQYPPGIGVAALREAVAAQRKRQFGIDHDPQTEVLVAIGATEAIAAAVSGLVEPGSPR